MMPQKVFFGTMRWATRRAVLLVFSMALGLVIAGGLAVSLGTESAKAAFPGHNGPIAFVRGNTIKLINANGTVGTTLRTGARTSFPDISPNGRKVAYSRYDGHDPEIYTINIATRKIRKITSNKVEDFAPTWSPDGSRIAFVSDLENLLIKRADGTGKPIHVTVTHNSPVWGPELSPEWSPNGREIAFPNVDTGDIFVVNLATGHRRNLTKDGGASYDVSPDWAPNGSRVAFVGTNGNTGTYGIYTVSASDGSNRRQLASEPNSRYALQSPKYSPDGTRMAFVRADVVFGCPCALYTMNASDGSAKKAIPGGGFEIDWGVRARRR